MKKKSNNCTFEKDIFNLKTLEKDIPRLSLTKMERILKKTQRFMSANGFGQEYSEWFAFSMLTSTTPIGSFIKTKLKKTPGESEWESIIKNPISLTQWVEEKDLLDALRLLFILNLDVLVSVLGTHPERLAWVQ